MDTKKLFITFTVVIACFSTLFFNSCSGDQDLEPEMTYDQKENLFLKDFREKVRGETWKIEKMIVTSTSLQDLDSKDSTIYNLGTIFINNIYNDPINIDKFNQLEASFSINGEIIPFKSRLLAHVPMSDLESGTVFGLMEFAYYLPFSVSSNDFSEEHRFLDFYFFNDNYSMVLSEDGNTWIWKGLNRRIKEIVFTKRI